jgi:hypothetical protein
VGFFTSYCQYIEFVPGSTWVPVSPQSPKDGACPGGLQAVHNAFGNKVMLSDSLHVS